MADWRSRVLCAVAGGSILMSPAFADQRVARASDFLDSVGVEVHLRYTDSGYAKIGRVLEALEYIGVLNVRDSPPVVGGQGVPSFERAADAGVKFDFTVRYPDIPGTLERLADFQSHHPGAVSFIEGPNEVDHQPVTFGELKGTAAASAYQAELYKSVKSTPQLADVPVIAFTDTPIRPDNKCDFANWHPYPPHGEQPRHAFSLAASRLATILPGKPIIFTEAGYYTLPQQRNWGGVDEATQAKYTLNMVLDGFSLGVRRTYIYQLLDAYPDRTQTNREAHFGLFDLDYRPKPAATALHNLVALLRDDDSARGSREPTAHVEVAGLPDTANTLALKKADGTTIVVIWNEPQIWDYGAAQAIPYESKPITVAIPEGYSVHAFDPIKGAGPIEAVSDRRNLRLDLGDRPIVLALTSR
jgi:hypothetical protein